MQSAQMDNNTRVTLKDARVLGHPPELLQALIVYQGIEPSADQGDWLIVVRKTRFAFVAIPITGSLSATSSA
jgi:hypothetical protein